MLPLFTRIDHVGIACRNLDERVALYESAFGLSVVHTEINEGQGVREAMLAVGGSFVQLLEPTRPDSPVARFLDRNGEGVHHIGYGVDDVAAALAALAANGITLVDERPRHGSMGAAIAFVYPKSVGGVLTELVQSATAPPRP
jgi:methylmalonyl-CoA/ethylmalonyl-CoA epimerase